MVFRTYITTRDSCSKAGLDDANAFYERALTDALAMQSAQFFFQVNSERTWELVRKPCYNVWPSIVPMLTRLNLDLDSGLIQLPLPALCIRLPRQHNPLGFQWHDQPFEIRSLLLSEINDGRGLSVLIDIGEMINNGFFEVPIFTYRNFLRRAGVTVEQELASLGKGITADMGVRIPLTLIDDCVRLCCSLCLLENDRSVIEPDVLSKDRDKFEASGDDRYVDKAQRRGKIGWNVGGGSKSPRTTGDRTWRWSGTGGAKGGSKAGQRSPSGTGGEGAERVWGVLRHFLQGGQRRQSDVGCMRAACGGLLGR